MATKLEVSILLSSICITCVVRNVDSHCLGFKEYGLAYLDLVSHQLLALFAHPHHSDIENIV